jgi:outer membrane receptor protein involved in Fe transport
MIQRLFFAIAIIGVIQGANAQSQSGSLKGSITEYGIGDPVPMANVVLFSESEVVAGSVADFDGNYTIKPINPGRYTLKVSFIGFATKQISEVLVSSNKITFLSVELKTESEVLGEVELVEYVIPLIDPDKSGTTKTKEEIMTLPTRNVQSVAAQTAGIFQKDEGSDLNVRGSRSDATFFYIDGVKVRASNKLPQSSIEQMTVITGGLPASYGDATGGIVSITTRGPSNEFFGGVEFNTSEGLDPYGYNLFGFNLSGPLKRNSLGKPVLGFFVSGEYESEKDPDPSAVGAFKLKDDVMKDLQQHPLIFSFDNGKASSERAGEFITNEDIVHVDARQNVASQNSSIQGKLDFKPSLKSNITMGGNFSNSKYRSDVYDYTLFNPQNNPEVVENSWRVYGRFQHRFGVKDQASSNALVKNAYITLQADYSKDRRLVQDAEHGDKLFNYGYIGTFTPVRKDSIVTPDQWRNKNNTINVLGIDSLYNIAPNDTIFGLSTSDWSGASVVSNVVLSKKLIQNYTYENGGLNPYAEHYTKSYFEFMGKRPVSSLEDVTGVGALVNGDRSQNIYSMWFNSGREYNGFSKTDNSQLRFTGSASADIKNHALQFGFEYEQRDDRYYTVNPIGLWGLAEQKANNYIEEYDGAYVYSGLDALHGTVITKLHSYQYDDMSSFAKNFRNKHEISRDEIVDIHTYSPDQLDVGMFSADEILNNGSSYASWSGYDYRGNRLNGVQPGMHEFLTHKDSNGDFKREIGAFQPIYMAGYIQDKFAFEDLIFNIGVRVDRYDANQEVLKDKYSLYEVMTAGDVKDLGIHPSNIGDDFVVYVDDNTNAKSITGYRNGDDWYNAEGLPTNNPEALNVSKGVLPMLTDPDALLNGDALNKGLSADAFQDYSPEVIVMPRISFSFPISDEAMFYAYYDVLAQRPLQNRSNPLDYLFLAYKKSRTISNPNLKPQKTTNYEVGFKQTLSSSSALTINAFYKEMRDMIQFTKVGFAFPIGYNTYGNIDFGTVKGLSLAYEMRRTNNLSLNANYTMQFADGSGSSPTSGVNIVNSSQPNLRTTLPLDYDQRHNLMTSVDFRYGKDTNYNGPLWNGKQIFANTGINLLATVGSGTPYSRQVSATSIVDSRSALAGSINGSRLPWTYRIDMRINKSFDISWGGPEEQNLTFVNVYVQVQNLLNTKNIVKVYRYTGNPDDDGYLASPIGIDDIEKRTDPTSYVDLYGLYSNDPGNYTRPRTVRLGVTLDF